MQLKRLEIQGFKSFADRTVVEFEEGITSIVGPNGSGKSNISDAIRWVLGEQSAKSLRGAKMEDVIFAGTQQRKMLGLAEVSMVLDNSDHLLNIDFDEVVVTRRVFRSGESEYLINKSQVRLRDVQELFMDTGVGRDGYSIIGQGKIENIISSKSDERRSIFEEASGIVKYRVRKDEALRKLNNTELNLERVNDILTEIDKNLGPLEEKSIKAKEYLDLKSKLKDVDVKLFLNIIDNVYSDTNNLEEKIQSLATSIEQNEKDIESFQNISNDTRVCLEELLLETETKQEKYFSTLAEIDKLKSKIEAFDDRMTSYKENIEKLKEEIKEGSLSIELLQEEIVTRTSKKENGEKNKERFTTELAEKEEELKAITQNMSEKELEIESIKRTIDEKKEELNVLKTNIAIATEKVENSRKRIETIEKESQSSIYATDGIKLDFDEIQEDYFKEDKLRKSLDAELKKLTEEKKSTDEFFVTYTNKENEFKQKIIETRSKLNYLQSLENENEGYVRSVKSILDLSKKNSIYTKKVFGTLAGLIETDEVYEKAIEVSLGGYIQNIVVDTDSSASELVKFLKEQLLGRATFLPLESIKLYREDIPSTAKSKEGYINTAINLVRYDKKFDSAVRLALGRTIIVDTIENGIKISKITNSQAKIVTLDGEVIAATGSITGGQVAGKQMTLVGRNRKLEDYKKRLTKLEKDYGEHLEKFKVKKDLREELEQKLIKVTEEASKQNTVCSVIEERLRSVERQSLKQEELKLSRINEKETLASNILDLEKDIEVGTKAIDDILNKIGNLNDEVTEYERFNREKAEKVNFLNEDIVNLKISVSSFDESSLAIDEMIEKINQDIENFNVTSLRKQDLIGEYEEELKNGDMRNEEDKTKLIELQDLSDELKKENDTLKIQRDVNINKQRDIENSINITRETLDKLKEEKNKLDNKKFKIDSQTDQIKTKIWEDYEFTLDMAREYNKSLDYLNEVPKQKLEQSANKLKNEIKSLGDISVSSIDEFKELSERSVFIRNQKQDLEDTKSKLENLIENTTSIMKTQFAKQFKIINDNFQEVFKELFGGGKANLVLLDEKNILESGIEIEAEPPGKKLQNISLLSGGEKALTAIAILFAILKIKAPPFCVLDEIEAALDDINVARFASYIKDYSKEVQFLVITHRKGTMEIASSVYGVTMQEYGVSKLISMKMK